MSRDNEHYTFEDEQIDEEYREYVDRQFSEACGEEFSNHSILHAWYIFKKILEYACKHKQGVSLISGSLRMDFYSALVENFRAVLNEGIHVRALIVHPADGGEKNQLAQELVTNKHGTLYKVNSEKVESFPLPHLIVCADGGAYRLELDHEKASAVVAFGNKDFGKRIMCAAKSVLPPD